MLDRAAISHKWGSIWFPQLTNELATTWTSRLGISNLPPNWRQMLQEPIWWLLKGRPAMDHYFRWADKRPCSSNRQALRRSRHSEPEFLSLKHNKQMFERGRYWQDTALQNTRADLNWDIAMCAFRALEITRTLNRDLQPCMLKGKKVSSGGDDYLEHFSRLAACQNWEKWNQSACLQRKLKNNGTSAFGETDTLSLSLQEELHRTQTSHWWSSTKNKSNGCWNYHQSINCVNM